MLIVMHSLHYIKKYYLLTDVDLVGPNAIISSYALIIGRARIFEQDLNVSEQG